MVPFRCADSTATSPPALDLLVVLLHRGFVRGQLSLNLGRLVPGGSIEILLRIGKLIRVQPELSFRHIQIAVVHRSRRALSCLI